MWAPNLVPSQISDRRFLTSPVATEPPWGVKPSFWINTQQPMKVECREDMQHQMWCRWLSHWICRVYIYWLVSDLFYSGKSCCTSDCVLQLAFENISFFRNNKMCFAEKSSLKYGAEMCFHTTESIKCQHWNSWRGISTMIKLYSSFIVQCFDVCYQHAPTSTAC